MLTKYYISCASESQAASPNNKVQNNAQAQICLDAASHLVMGETFCLARSEAVSVEEVNVFLISAATQ